METLTRFSRSFPFFLSCQMAEARGVPRGNYDGPVHDVISMTKSVPPTPTTRGPPCPKTLTGSRNLHQSGFTLAGCEHILTEIWSAGWVAFWVVQLSASYGIMTSYFLPFQEHRLMTTYLVVPLRGLWHHLVDGPTLPPCHKACYLPHTHNSLPPPEIETVISPSHITSYTG